MEMSEISRQLTVLNAAGFHVRVASLVSKTAMKYESQITLSRNGYKADCKSCLDLLAIMATQGTVLTLVATGGDAKEAVDRITFLFDKKFGEDEYSGYDFGV